MAVQPSKPGTLFVNTKNGVCVTEIRVANFSAASAIAQAIEDALIDDSIDMVRSGFAQGGAGSIYSLDYVPRSMRG